MTQNSSAAPRADRPFDRCHRTLDQIRGGGRSAIGNRPGKRGFAQIQRATHPQPRAYVIDIGFTSHDRDKSARIVNAIADVYIDDQLNAKYQATRRASLWLQERIAELRTQATAAERAVLDQRQKQYRRCTIRRELQT
jgi:hypothetical protein